MKLEPVAWRVEHDETIFTSYQRGAAEGYALTNGGLPITPLYAIPEGYAVVPVEPTFEMISKMLEGMVVQQSMEVQAKLVERLRQQYKGWIAAAKGE